MIVNNISSEYKNLFNACQALNSHVSFHIPGHKGAITGFEDINPKFDLTELEGLDDLYQPSGVLLNLENNISQIFGVYKSIVSTNGASGLIIASLLSFAQRGYTHVIIPRNAHSSIVSGVVLSGLDPIWLEVDFDSQWQIATEINPKKLEKLIVSNADKRIAGVYIVSPSYSGCISDLNALKIICHKYNLRMIVDETHGSHMVFGRQKNLSAIYNKADIVIHSMHKTLLGLTQAAVLHISQNIDSIDLLIRQNLKLVSTSSPSYIIMASIENSLNNLSLVETINQLSFELMARVDSRYIVYSNLNQDLFHVFIKCHNAEACELDNYLKSKNIYTEAVLGFGLLLMLGAGTRNDHIDYLIKCLNDFEPKYKNSSLIKDFEKNTEKNDFQQVMNPQKAYFSKSKYVKASESCGLIASQIYAKCPPGIPILVPGVEISASQINAIEDLFVRVVDV